MGWSCWLFRLCMYRYKNIHVSFDTMIINTLTCPGHRHARTHTHTKSLCFSLKRSTMKLQLGLMVLQGTAPRLLPVNTTHRTYNKEDNGILMVTMFKTFAFVTISSYGEDIFSVLSIHYDILIFVEVTTKIIVSSTTSQQLRWSEMLNLSPLLWAFQSRQFLWRTCIAVGWPRE